MRKLLCTVLAVALAVGSLYTLAGWVGLRDAPGIAQGSPSAVSTVRAYYAAVNHYITTGEADAIHDVIDPDMLDPREDSGRRCAAPSLLPALRLTYPQMHITIDDLIRDGSTVVAQVSVDTGLAMSFDSVGLLPLEHRWVTEIFTVVDGRIVNCAAYGPGQALVGSMHRMTSAIATPGALVIARISFAREAQDYLSIPAPAHVSVEHGTLETLGNGVSVLSRMNGQQAETTEPGRNYFLTPGDELAVSTGRMVLHNPEDKPARVLATTLVPHVIDIGEAEARSQVQRLFEGLIAPVGEKVSAGTWVRTLARSAEPIGTGAIELLAASIVVTPGGSATLEGAATDMLIIPLTGNPLIERSGPNVTIRNPGADQVLIQIAGAEERAPP